MYLDPEPNLEYLRIPDPDPKDWKKYKMIKIRHFHRIDIVPYIREVHGGLYTHNTVNLN